MGRALEIRHDPSAAELRAHAAREEKNRAARRMLAIANAPDGMSRADAARAAGMDRQALRGEAEEPTVRGTAGPTNGVRYNAEGLAGLHDRPTSGRPPALTEAELALLSAHILRGPDSEADGVSSWTLPDLCRWIEA
ncbi:MAG TPA: helix-turn-helix domain-containing protein, partial [Chondromyces sp.]|nr:helix-turn-helix domain-containing protein [Chondromyces sp.]